MNTELGENKYIFNKTHSFYVQEKDRVLPYSYNLKRGMKAKIQRRLTSFAEIEKIANENDLIIYAGYLAMHRPKGGLFFFGEECETFHFAFSHGKEKSIGVSFGYPYIHYDFMGSCSTFINAYNKAPDMMTAFVEAIFGEIPIVGKSPVPLDPGRVVW